MKKTIKGLALAAILASSLFASSGQALANCEGECANTVTDPSPLAPLGVTWESILTPLGVTWEAVLRPLGVTWE